MRYLCSVTHERPSWTCLSTIGDSLAKTFCAQSVTFGYTFKTGLKSLTASEPFLPPSNGQGIQFHEKTAYHPVDVSDEALEQWTIATVRVDG